jgi:hypothetical protein
MSPTKLRTRNTIILRHPVFQNTPKIYPTLPKIKLLFKKKYEQNVTFGSFCPNPWALGTTASGKNNLNIKFLWAQGTA